MWDRRESNSRAYVLQTLLVALTSIPKRRTWVMIPHCVSADQFSRLVRQATIRLFSKCGGYRNRTCTGVTPSTFSRRISPHNASHQMSRKSDSNRHYTVSKAVHSPNWHITGYVGMVRFELTQ